MFSYLILVGVASRLVNEFRILTHLLAISSYALCLPTHPLPFIMTIQQFPSVLPFAIRNSRSLERQTTKHGSQESIITFIQFNHETKCLCISHIALHPSIQPLGPVRSGVRGPFTNLQDQDE